MSPEDIDNRFAYHAPSPCKVDEHRAVRNMFWANAAIARDRYV